MVGDRCLVVLERSIDLIDNSKTGNERYHAKLGPGEFTATLIKNPTPEGGSNWLLFTDSNLGATLDYIRTVAKSITTLPS